MAIEAIHSQSNIPFQSVEQQPTTEMESGVQIAPIAKEKLQRVMHKLIKIMAELQQHLLEVNKELNQEKSRATKEMMQAYKDAARMLHWQAGGASLMASTGAYAIYSPDAAAFIIQYIAPMCKEVAQKPCEGWQRTYEGAQRKFEQLSNELGQTTQSTTAVLDGISDKLQGAMRNAAPAA